MKEFDSKALTKLLQELQDAYEVVREDHLEQQEKAVLGIDYETRLHLTAWTIRKICEHAREGGSFRTLIYDRLQFNPDAYIVLYEAGAMELNNKFDLE